MTNTIPLQFTPVRRRPSPRERLTRPVAAMLVMMAVATVGVGGYALFTTRQTLTATRAQVRSLTAARDTLTSELADTRASLDSTKTQLQQAQDGLASAQSDLADARQSLSRTQSSLTAQVQRGDALTTNRVQLLSCLHVVLQASEYADDGDYVDAASLLQANTQNCKDAIEGAGLTQAVDASPTV